jgi:thioredoxin 1
MMETVYKEEQPTRADIGALAGPAVLEFGTNWCGYCRGAQAAIAEAYRDYPEIPHFKVEDGPGRVLGRAFRVKLWPTVIFLKDGQEVARVVRPEDADELREGFALIAGA